MTRMKNLIVLRTDFAKGGVVMASENIEEARREILISGSQRSSLRQGASYSGSFLHEIPDEQDSSIQRR